MFGIRGPNNVMFSTIEQEKVNSPLSRKELDGRFIYLTRKLPFPEVVVNPVLGDFGFVILLNDDLKYREAVQPKAYHAPEVIIKTP